MNTLTVRRDGTGTAQLGSRIEQVSAANAEDARARLSALVSEHAALQGESVHVVAREGSTAWELIFHPDGTVTIPESRPSSPRTPARALEVQSADEFQAMLGSAASPPDRAVPLEAPPGPRRSFITPTPLYDSAVKGWRGLLNATRLTRLAPGPAEEQERRDIQAVSQYWPGPRTIAVVNGKGGAGKTPAVAMLSAVFARWGGAGILAWDNNQTRGTLGWRTESGPHEATLVDLIPAVPRMLGGDARVADLAHYVHHQTQDRYDVLRSKPMAVLDTHRITPHDVAAIHSVASKYYRLVIMDSGNDESDPAWRAMVNHANQLVVVTTTRDDHAEAGALLREALAEQGGHAQRLATTAVTIVTQADRRASRAQLDSVAAGYRGLSRAAVTVPYDPTMVDGLLRFGALRRSTRTAWLSAGAAVARGL